MDNNNSRPGDANIKHLSHNRYKPVKRHSLETDNTLVKVLESLVNGLEQSLGKRTYLCGNPDCGTLIVFHSNEPRPVVCHRCGIEIDWEGEYMMRIKICPKCNKEYESNSNFCSLHLPALALFEKEVEK
jgi:hypothetical protein